ncbi:CpaF family protein, partial [Dietzia sp. E1]|nr:CpaF family protein [Dietzia sp. E1]
MSLSDRLRAARVPAAAAPAASEPASPSSAVPVPDVAVPVAPVTTTRSAGVPTPPRPASGATAGTDEPAIDPLISLKEQAAGALFERIGARLNNPSLTEDQLHAMVRAELNTVVEEQTIPLTGDQRKRLITDVQADVLGHGPLERLLEDPDITEIMVNG